MTYPVISFQDLNAQFRIISNPYKYLHHNDDGLSNICAKVLQKIEDVEVINCQRCLVDRSKPRSRWLVCIIIDDEIKILDFDHSLFIELKKFTQSLDLGNPADYYLVIDSNNLLHPQIKSDLKEHHQKLKDNLDPNWFNKLMEISYFYK